MSPVHSVETEPAHVAHAWRLDCGSGTAALVLVPEGAQRFGKTETDGRRGPPAGAREWTAVGAGAAATRATLLGGGSALSAQVKHGALEGDGNRARRLLTAAVFPPSPAVLTPAGERGSGSRERACLSLARRAGAFPLELELVFPYLRSQRNSSRPSRLCFRLSSKQLIG